MYGSSAIMAVVVRGATLYHHTHLTHNFWYSAVLYRRQVALAIILCLLAPTTCFFLVFLFYPRTTKIGIGQS